MLLCDGCDKGWHMFCVRPPVKVVPKGDWFCPECNPPAPAPSKKARRSTSAGKREERKEEKKEEVGEEEEEDTACVVCTKTTDAKKMLLCDECDLGWHMFCVRPPVKVVPKGEWFCPRCVPATAPAAAEARRSKGAVSPSTASPPSTAPP
eukprot:31146-Prorocentrum_minimum.AAC.1